MRSRRPAWRAGQCGEVSLSYAAVVAVVALVLVALLSTGAPRMAAGVERGVRCAIAVVPFGGRSGGCGAAAGPGAVADGASRNHPAAAPLAVPGLAQPTAEPEDPGGVLAASVGLPLLLGTPAGPSAFSSLLQQLGAAINRLVLAPARDLVDAVQEELARAFGRQRLRQGPGVDQRQPVDYAKLLGDSHVVAFGDRPGSVDIKRALTQALPELRRLGVTDLWLEALPPGNNDPYAVRERLQAAGDRLGVGGAYLNLYDRARQLGINVEAEGPAQQRVELASHTMYAYRNRQWVDQLTRYLKEHPDRKVAVLAAAGHFGDTDLTFDRMLRDAGTQPVVVFYRGGDARTLQERTPDLDQTYTRLAGQGPGSFMVRPSSPDAGDYVIHIP